MENNKKERMKKINLIWIIGLFFIFLIPSGFSIPLGFNSCFYGNASTNKTGYTLVGGCAGDGTGAVINGFGNGSYFMKISVSNSTGNISTSDCEINFSMSGAAGEKLQFITGGLAPTLSTGIVCEWQENHYFTQANQDSNFMIGGGVGNSLDVGNVPQVGFINGVNTGRKVLYYQPDAWAETTNIGGLYNDWMNVTFVINSTSKSSLYMNNTDGNGRLLSAIATWTAPWNFTILTNNDVNNNMIGIRRLRCFPLSTGCPQVTSPLIPDTTSPSVNITNINGTTKIGKNDLINISCLGKDDIALSTGNITLNITGYNSSFTLSGTSSYYSINFTNNLTRGNVINATCYVTDTSGNFAQNSTLISVSNATISPPTIILPVANDYNNTLTNYFFNITYQNPTLDGVSITQIRWYVNGVLNQTTTGNTTFNASEGYYILNVSITDGILWSANATVNFTLDQTFPVLDSLNLSNNSVIGYQNITFLIQVSDTNIFNLTYTLHNSSIAMIYSDYNSSRPNGGTTLRLMPTLNLTGLASGNYTLDINFSDTHTKREIKSYSIRKDWKDVSLNYVTDEDPTNEFKVVIVGNDIPTDNIGTEKRTDRYMFFWDFSQSNSKTETTHTYIFDITSKKMLRYLENSRYKGHFITDKNWVTFDLKKGYAEYEITKIEENHFRIKINTTETYLEFNSIGGVNVVNMFLNIRIDNQLPDFPSNSINNTFINASDRIAASFVCKDIIALSTCILATNSSGSWQNVTNVTMPNNSTESYNLTYYDNSTKIDGGTIGYQAFANDTFNKFSSSALFTASVSDSINPIVNGSLNNTIFFTNMSINASFNASDNVALSNAQIFITENSATRIFNFTTNGATSFYFWQNITIASQIGTTINITAIVNDTGGRIARNQTLIDVTKMFILQARNIYDNTTITSFSIIIINNTFYRNHSTTNGTIPISNFTWTGLYNLTYSFTNIGSYLNRTYENHNISNDLTGELYQSIVYINVSRRGTGISILNFSASLPMRTPISFNSSNLSGSLRFYLNASNYEVSIKSTQDRYYDNVLRINLTNQSISYWTGELYDTNVSISVYSANLNQYIHNFTIKLRGNGSTFTENLSDNDVGNITFNLGNNTYFITIGASGHSPSSTSFYFVSNSSFYNLSFTIGGLNVLNFSIFDEFNYQLITTNLSLALIGSTTITNLSTTNGTLYFAGLQADDYRVRYQDALGIYRQRDYYLTIENGTNSSVRLFLLSIGNGTFTTFTLTDQNANPATNLTVKAQRYFTQSNAYELVVMARTDSQGKAQLDLQQNNPFYKFLIIGTDGKILLDTVPSVIFTSTYSLKVNTGGNSFANIRNGELTFSNLTFSNLSNSFTLVYNDVKGLGVNTCLIANEISLSGGANQICNTCSSSSSATLVCAVNSSYIANNTIVAKAFLYGAQDSNSTAILLAEKSIIPKAIIQVAKEIFGVGGVLFGFALTVTMIMVGLWNPIVAMILGLFGFILSFMMGIITLGQGSWELVVGLTILGGIIMYRSRA